MPTEPQQSQETPQGETIPVPTRQAVLGDLRKVAKPVERREQSPEDDEANGDHAC